MRTEPDETHAPERRSWVESGNRDGADFPIQNLPFSVFRRLGSESAARVGVAIGDQILDLAAGGDSGLLDEAGPAVQACAQPTLNSLMSLDRSCWRRLRRVISGVLETEAGAAMRRTAAACLIPISDAEFLLPAAIGDYTDFYASIFHATNVGRLFRPDDALQPNYRWVPVGYHGRSSSIIVSGSSLTRPNGQTKAGDADAPTYGPSQQLDYEAELGFFVGTGNHLGESLTVDQAAERIFGVCLLNDWSARDIQSWEYQPLGPFLSKSFATTISPWVLTMEALTPFRTARFSRAPNDPQPLPHLDDNDDRTQGGLDVTVDVLLATEAMRQANGAPERLSRVHFRDMYWTAAQLLAHHTSNGCNLRPGDLLGSGTISNPQPNAVGSLIELTRAGRQPERLTSGESRGYLEDGDEVILRAFCERDGYTRIGFGECRGRIQPRTTAG